jgi:hypothetical protein
MVKEIMGDVLAVFMGGAIRVPGNLDAEAAISSLLENTGSKSTKSGRQQPNAAGYGISDDDIITDVFMPVY